MSGPIMGSPEFEAWFERFEKEKYEEGALNTCKQDMFAAYLHGQASVLQAVMDGILRPDWVCRAEKRYEKLRKLTPLQFKGLWEANVEGAGRFDDLVDALEED